LKIKLNLLNLSHKIYLGGYVADTFSFKRSPAVYRDIKNINPENDSRVRILGKVINKKNDIMMIDDGTGVAEITLMDDIDVAIGENVRVFCRVLPLEEGYELRGEIVQKVDGLNIEYYKKAIKLFEGI